MTFDGLLTNLCHASTGWWKTNKNLTKFSCGILLLLWCILFFWIN